MSAGEDDLFGRWSRRKQAARRLEAEEAAGRGASREAEAGEDTGQPIAEPEPADSGEPTEPPPSLDDLTAESDLTAFLRKDVPAALRNAAMRKMWSLDPAIRDHVGLSENAWDFNKPGAMPGFGPLAAGRAVVDFLSAVGREAPAEPEATPAAAEVPDVESDEVAGLSPEAEDMLETPAPQAATEAAPAAEAAGSADPQPDAAKPRHGGAVPR